jgi:hypothetical protein
MIPTPLQPLAELSKLQEQVLLPFFVKLSRVPEQLLINVGVESATDMEPAFFAIYEKCRDYTLKPFKEMYALYEAAAFVAKAGIEGDFVE